MEGEVVQQEQQQPLPQQLPPSIEVTPTNGHQQLQQQLTNSNHDFKIVYYLFKNFLQNYEKWFIQNTSSVSSVERALWYATFFVPFGGQNETKTTIMNTFLELVTAYHDYVWSKYSILLKAQHITVDPAVRAELEKVHFPETHLTIAFILTIIQHTELLCEILATHFQQRFPYLILRNTKWIIITTIELVKAYLRLILLFRGGGAILGFRQIPSRNLDSSRDTNAADEDNINIRQGPERIILLDILRSLSKMREEMRANDIERSTTPDLHIITAEILWIIRPLVYLYLLYKNGQYSWWPWLVSLCMELTSLRCLQHKRLNKLESKEIQHRKMLLFFYLLKSPFFETWINSSPMINLNERLKRGIPRYETVQGTIELMLNMYRCRYFYLAGTK